MKGRDCVTVIHHIIKAATVLAHAVGGGGGNAKVVHPHRCLPLWQIATLRQEVGECEAWTH